MSAQMAEAHRRWNGVGFDDQTSTDTLDCADAAAERKSLATLQACLAREGYQLRRAGPGFLLIDPIGRTRALATMQEAQGALDKIGGVQ